MNNYLDRLKMADLFLDTFSNSTHDCSDALWVGLPVLTLAGKLSIEWQEVY